MTTTTKERVWQQDCIKLQENSEQNLLSYCYLVQTLFKESLSYFVYN